MPIADIEKNSFLTTTLVQKSEPAIQNRRKTTTLIFQIKIVVVLTHIEVSKLSPAKEKEDNNVGREYFSTHERLSDLSEAKLVTDTIESLNKGEHALMESEHFGWGIAEGTIPEHMRPILDEQVKKG